MSGAVAADPQMSMVDMRAVMEHGGDATKVQGAEQPRSAFAWRFVRESIAFVSVRGNKIGMGADRSRWASNSRGRHTSSKVRFGKCAVLQAFDGPPNCWFSAPFSFAIAPDRQFSGVDRLISPTIR
jgi:hypothetical protein